jgi:uncharacterized protein (DUF2147 family)
MKWNVMRKLRVLSSAVMILNAAAPAPLSAAELDGVWLSQDGATKVAVAPCRQNARFHCATVLSDRPQPGEPSEVGKVVGYNFASSGEGWEGMVTPGGREPMAATLRLRSADRLELKVCLIALLCDVQIYQRIDRPN